MPRTASKVTQADIARAIRALAQTGAKMMVEVAPDGAIRFIPIENANRVTTSTMTSNPLPPRLGRIMI
jgi:hypothetical protein